MIHLGAQYYRAPFPVEKYWEDDLRRMKDAGLNTVQLWVLWGWVESKPGAFVFDDYDRLVALAEKNGLEVVLSTIAEIQPYWIHRELPGSEMIDHLGRTVVSGNRAECHFGITPGGCTDNPAVWERMKTFLERVVTRYAKAPNLAGWDSWNELRWNVHAHGKVCYCRHTIERFHRWLDDKYGGLDGLNEAWNRRYGRWDEVWPGIDPYRPSTEMMAWEHFITWKCCSHGAARYEVMKGIDPDHAVTLHGGGPSIEECGGGDSPALDRGNDWFYADVLDGVGCSSFPKWLGIDDAEFGMRIEMVRSAARGKHVWLSELQGGRSAQGFNVYESVDACSQQRWIWNGLACGADTILFWCWRDEVFTSEAGGFGIIGLDGCAEERVEHMRVTGRVLAEHGALLEQYAPTKPSVGVLFSPQSYYYYYSQDANAWKPMVSLKGYCRALVRRSIPFAVVEEEHLEELDGLKVLFMPRATALSVKTQDALIAFARAGGTLVVESECGAFGPNGIYRYPEERFLAREAGLKEVGRRKLSGETIRATLGEDSVDLGVLQWATPLVGENLFTHAASDEGALLASAAIGEGRIVYCGSYPGEAYHHKRNPAFEDYVEWAARGAGWVADIEVMEPAADRESFLYVKHGEAGGRRVIFVFFQERHVRARLLMRADLLKTPVLRDLITGTVHEVKTVGESRRELVLEKPEWGFAVLVEEQPVF